MQECRNFFWNHLLCITFLLAICTTPRHASIKCHIPYHFGMLPWKKYWNEIFSHCVPPPPPKEEGRDLLMGMYTYYVFCGWPLQTLSGWRRKGLHTGLHMQEPTWGFWETTLGQWSGEKILMLIQPYATRPFNHNRSVPNLSKKNVCQWHFAEHTTCNKVIVVYHCTAMPQISSCLPWFRYLLFIA